MPSYDLNQLGSDKFEQLIQSLLKEIIGSGTTTFGVGKDGAREATYHGAAPYPSSSENWKGDWIFQVKFHDTQLGIDKARTTVRRELSSELEKIVTKYAHKCDNYIFVTNVPLSGVYQSGDHDFVQDDIKPKFPSIKNIHIWGADEIHRFLDQYESIRHAYNLISLEDWNQRKKQISQPAFKLELPTCAEPEIERDSLTRHIADSFQTGKQNQILSAQTRNGKTILVSQFKRHYSDKTIVYFIDHTPASQNIHTFLYSICCQMADILNQPSPNIELQAEALSTVASQHLTALNRLAIEQQTKYYILIDGIEHSFPGVKGSRIIDKLPLRTYSESPFVLLTIEQSKFHEIPQVLNEFPQINLPLNFDKEQTRKFFGNLLSPMESDSVHQKYGGVPGYLHIIKQAKLLNSGYDLKSSPTDLIQLLQQQVDNAFSSMSPEYKQIVEMLAVCNSSLPKEILLGFTDRQEVINDAALKDCILIRHTNGRYEIENKEIQNIVRNQLTYPIANFQNQLWKYIEDKFPSEELAIDALIYELQDQEGVQQRLQIQPIIKTLANSTTGLSTILNRFNSAISMAYKSKDMERLLSNGVGITIARRFPEHLVHQGQIDALIAIDEWQQAVNRAYLINDPTTQISTLSRIFKTLQLRRVNISDDALDSLRYKIQSLNLSEIDRGLLKQIAIEILPIFPDIAIELLETEIGVVEGQSIVEFALDTMMLQPAEEDDTLDIRSDKYPRVSSLFSGKYGYWELTNQLLDFRSTKAKEYVIRKWCSSNPTSKHLVDGLELWQRTIIDDRHFVVPLRCLREISGLVKNVPTETRLSLIKKLEVPHIFALEAPIEDWIQVQANLAEAIYELDQNACIDYLKVAYQKFEERELDLDQAAYYLARLLLALKQYYPSLTDQVNIKLQETFYKLRDNSAEQYNAIRRVLPIWVEIDKEAAFIIATELNTFNRRKKAVRLVLTHALKKLGEQNLTQLIEDSIKETGKTDSPHIITAVLIELAEDRAKLHIENLNSLASFVEKLNSAELRAASCKSLGILHEVISSDKASCWFDESISAWHLMDDMKKQFAIGYEIVEDYAEIDITKAKIFYEVVENLKNKLGSHLAIGALGADYRHALGLSIRALTREHLLRQADIFFEIVQKIDVLPSNSIKAELYASLAVALYRLEFIIKADEIVRLQLLPLIKKGEDSYEQITILQESLTAIFRYGLQESLDIIDGMDSIYIDTACYNAISWRLTNTYLGDHEHISLDKICIPNTIQTLSDCCELTNKIGEDYLISLAVKLISQCIGESLIQDEIDPQQAYNLTNTLEEIVNNKLPQKSKNIKHDGYKILALANINHCRSKLFKYLEATKRKSPRNFRREPIKKQWEELTKQARQISNISDKVLVLSEIAVLSFSYYTKEAKPICKNLLTEAERLIENIPTLIDRASRLEHVGECWHRLEDNEQAKYIYRLVIQLTNQLYGVDAEQRLRSLVQSASVIDEEFAEKILSDLDTNRLPSGVIRSAKNKYEIGKIIAHPSRNTISGSKVQREQALHEAYLSWLSSLIIGKRVPEHSSKLLDQFKESLEYSPGLIYQVTEWCIENIQRGTLRGGIDAEEFVRLAEVADKISRFATDNSDQIAGMLHDSKPITSDKIRSFGVGEYKKASQFICDWVRGNAKDSIVFCDPYFGLSELIYLRYVPIECPITIITTERGVDISTGTEQAKRDVVSYWRSITDQELPEITIYVYPLSSEEKFHDRAIVSNPSAISMGQSLNGLGKSRGIINLLSNDEAKELEDKYIDPLLQVTKQRKGYRPAIIDISA